MADVTLIDVLKGCVATWAVGGALAAIVPANRVFAFGVGEQTPLPYAAVEAEDVSNFFGGTQYLGGVDYIKAVNVTFSVYGFADDMDWIALAEAMQMALSFRASDPYPKVGDWIVPNSTGILSAIRELETGPEPTGQKQDGKWILVYGYKVELKYTAQHA